MPTAMHPWMKPADEFIIWPHGDREIYETFDSIFSCKGHGWSNLQSMHINLPFRNNDEFYKLHGAIRFILPLITALTASSPLIEGYYSRLHDTRMDLYRTNCARIPSLTAMIVPEPVSGINDYQEKILNKIYKDIKPYPNSSIISEEWVNARGAIARFERGTIEIRTADIQECPLADLSSAELIIETLKSIINNNSSSIEEMNNLATEDLYRILMDIIKTGEKAEINNSTYLGILNMPGKKHSAGEILWNLFERNISKTSPYRSTIKKILTYGSLSSRIKSAIGPDPVKNRIYSVYKDLCSCLKNNEIFLP
jgi:carboxylate-amine ligase